VCCGAVLPHCVFGGGGVGPGGGGVGGPHPPTHPPPTPHQPPPHPPPPPTPPPRLAASSTDRPEHPVSPARIDGHHVIAAPESSVEHLPCQGPAGRGPTIEIDIPLPSYPTPLPCGGVGGWGENPPIYLSPSGGGVRGGLTTPSPPESVLRRSARDCTAAVMAHDAGGVGGGDLISASSLPE